MSQRIVTECDVCAADGVQRDGLPEEVSALGRHFIIDVCEQHEKELRAVIERLADLGRDVGGRVDRRSQRVTCPRCGQPFGTARALGIHTREAHGETLAETRAATASPSNGEFVCPHDGREFRSRQALSMHRFRAHGERAGEAREDG